jgi:uncharacterized protein (DUF427 family)
MGRPTRIEPGPGQESVWDYPRPPAVVPDTRLVRVALDGVTVGETRTAIRVLETSQAPAFYLPPGDLDWAFLDPSAGSSFCEWKGQADYLAVIVDRRRVDDAGWRYRDPTPAFTALRDHVAFYPGRVECFVDNQRVEAMPGGFYGGWITPEVVGPFKGAPGTLHW